MPYSLYTVPVGYYGLISYRSSAFGSVKLNGLLVEDIQGAGGGGQT